MSNEIKLYFGDHLEFCENRFVPNKASIYYNGYCNRIFDIKEINVHDSMYRSTVSISLDINGLINLKNAIEDTLNYIEINKKESKMDEILKAAVELIVKECVEKVIEAIANHPKQDENDGA